MDVGTVDSLSETAGQMKFTFEIEIDADSIEEAVDKYMATESPEVRCIVRSPTKDEVGGTWYMPTSAPGEWAKLRKKKTSN
jgi:hypothetical protein